MRKKNKSIFSPELLAQMQSRIESLRSYETDWGIDTTEQPKLLILKNRNGTYTYMGNQQTIDKLKEFQKLEQWHTHRRSFAS